MNRIFSGAGRFFRGLGRLGRQAGQGTVEYVALILLVTNVKSGLHAARE
jgi:hypothetical protein